MLLEIPVYCGTVKVFLCSDLLFSLYMYKDAYRSNREEHHTPPNIATSYLDTENIAFLVSSLSFCFPILCLHQQSLDEEAVFSVQYFAVCNPTHFFMHSETQ